MTVRARVWFAAAAWCVLAAVLTWAVAFHTGHGQRWDTTVLHDAIALDNGPRKDRALNLLASLCNPLRYLVLTFVVLAWCARTRGLRAAAVMTVAVAGANVATQLLKQALAVERGDPYQVAAASWPSGHACAAMAVALVAIYAANRRWRPLVTLVALGFAVAIAVAVVMLGWHYPSDAIGGLAVAGAVLATAVGVLQPSTSPSRSDSPGDQRTSPAPLAPRERMNSRSESRLR
jgi:membrane-associated phospholipid phosphatase